MLGGTDVNVDAASRRRARRRARAPRAAADVVVRFFALDGRRRAERVAPTGDHGGRAAGRAFADAPRGATGTDIRRRPGDRCLGRLWGTEFVSEFARRARRVPSSTPVFLLPAGLRPVKDVLWVADAPEAAARRLARVSPLPESRGLPSRRRHPPPRRVGGKRALGPALDAAYASLVSEKARACSPSAGGAGAFVSAGPVPRGVAVEYMRAAAGVLNTSASGGQSGALLEAAAAGGRCSPGTSPGTARCWIFSRRRRRLVRPRTRALAQAMTCAWKTRKTRANEPNISTPLARSPFATTAARFSVAKTPPPRTPSRRARTRAGFCSLRRRRCGGHGVVRGGLRAGIGGVARARARPRARAAARRCDPRARRERRGWRDVAASLLGGRRTI